MRVWILTSECNEYDQFGEYFEKVFKDKPTKEDLRFLSYNDDYIEHILEGGGRRGDEYMWYHLRYEEL